MRITSDKILFLFIHIHIHNNTINLQFLHYLGDLCFVPRLKKNHKVKGRVLAVFQDGFSRFVSLNYQKDAKAKTTLKSFENALKNDFCTTRYTKFLRDRGNEYKVCFCQYCFQLAWLQQNLGGSWALNTIKTDHLDQPTQTHTKT